MTIERQYLFYGPVLFGASGVLLLKSVAYARFLSVESFGAFNQAVLIASTFTAFAGAGMQLLAQKMLPQFHARGDRQAIDDMLSCTLAVFGIATAIAAAGIAVAILAGWLRSTLVSLATLVFSMAQFLFLLCLIDVRSRMRFLEHAKISALRAVLLLVLGGAVAALTHDFVATLAIEGSITLLVALRLVSGERGRLILRGTLACGAELRRLGAMFPAALRLLLLNGTVTILYAIDKWTGVALLSKREYGVFALGLVVLTVFETLQAVLNVAVYPLMAGMFARGQQRRAFRLATLATIVVLAVASVCYVPLVLMLDYLVSKYLPLYADAKDVIALALIAGSLRLADFYMSFAILCSEEWRLARAFAFLASSAIVVIWSLYAIGLRFDPERLVMVTVAVSVCAFLIDLAVAVRAQRREYMTLPA